jgi:hypothetical protein
MAVDYLNPSRPFQWQTGGTCMDVRNGAKVDPDACEGNYPDWYKAQQAAKRAKAAGLPPPTASSTPKWVVPVAVVSVGLLALIMLRK